jgi:hypothetical protein
MEYSSSEQADIRSVFETFKSQEIYYVVPRGHQQLPASTQGGDIDVIVKESDFGAAVRLCEEVGFATNHNLVQGVFNLVVNGLQNPRSVLSLLVHTPAELVNHLSTAVTPGQPVSSVNSDFDDQRRFNGEIMFHFLNHVAYKSPLNNTMVRVNPEVEQSMFDHRQFVDGIAVPSLVDELTHLICRGVFDYDGEFPPRYIERCEEIKHDIIENEPARFRNLLSLTFFEASAIVFENVKKGKYARIKTDLISYSRY